MADEQIVEEEVADNDQPVTEDDLRDLKYGSEEVETSENEEDESEETTEEEESEEETDNDEDGQTEPQVDFVKQFPQIKGDTPEEYAKNLELAYQNSTAEALRLKGLTEKPVKEEDKPDITESDPVSLYMKQKMDDEITTTFADFAKLYPQVEDQVEYTKFTSTVAELSNTILQSEKRLASPKELYRKAAVILDWQSQEPTAEDKLKNAVKATASSSKTPGVTKKTASTSRVTDAMIAANRKMYPGKTDAQIREELEPYV